MISHMFGNRSGDVATFDSNFLGIEWEFDEARLGEAWQRDA